MPSQSYLTYRVRGIPEGLSRTSVKELIQKAVGCADCLEFRVKSLAKDLTRADQTVATFTLQTPSPNLPEPSGVAEQSYEVLLDAETDIELVIDTHFHGCTPLHCPDEEKWRFDLIAISGLNGHAFGSFKKPQAAYMWLRDSLAQDMPDSRIIIYGYDSKLQDSDSFQNVNDLGKKFQHAVREARRNSEKPLVLLGHSLGGIVIKEALHLMRTSTLSEDREIFSAISGILFFGVPNQGMDISSLIPMVENQANRGFIHTLESNSPILRMQAQQYSDAIANLSCDVVNFYETKKSPTAQKGDDGSWAMTGPRAVLVDSHSATHGRPHDSEHHRVYPIDRTHSDLVKFANAYDEAYITVLGYLRSFDIEVPRLNGSMLPSLTSSQQDCLKTLGFPEQFDRMDMLKPDNKTCDWLFTNTTFNTWLRSRNGLLWIRGNPGCGKSMSMKRTLEYLQGQNDAPCLIAHCFFHGQGKSLQKSSFGLYRSLLHQLYSHFPGCFSDLTQKFEQYCQKGPQDWRWMHDELHCFLMKGNIDISNYISTILLVDALDEVGESEAKAIANDLKSLVDAAEHEGAQLRICFSCRHYPQITLSGGETLIMDEANKEDIHTVVTTRIDSAVCFNGSEKDQLKSEILSKAAGNFQWAALVSDMIIETREKGDSFKVALKNLQRAPPTLELLYESLLDVSHEPQNDKQRQQMLKLFEWVTFAARPLTLEELQQAMALDCNMTEKSISEYQAKDTYIASSDLKTKVKSLSRGLVRFVESKDGQFQAVLIHQSVADFLMNGGLRFLITGVVADVTRLAHFQLSRSCLKYLSLREPRRWIREAHYEGISLLKAGLHLFEYAWLHWAFHTFCAKSQDQVVTDADESDNDLLAFFEWPNDEAFLLDWVKLLHNSYVMFYPSPHDLDFPLRTLRDLRPSLFPVDNGAVLNWPVSGSRLVHMLAFLGLQSPLEYLATQRHLLSTRSSHRRPLNVSDTVGSPLVYALAGSQRRTVHFLVQAGVKLNPKKLERGPGWSPVVLASQNPDPEFIELLFSRGAKAKNNLEGLVALHMAIESGNAVAINMLLDRGVDVKAPNAYDFPSPKAEWRRQVPLATLRYLLMTPLHHAIKSGNEVVAIMLLDRGANVHAQDNKGRTPLTYVFRFLQKPNRFALVLLDRGADPNTSLKTETASYFDNSSLNRRIPLFKTNIPLQYALETNDQVLLKTLLDKGVKIHEKNCSGISPLSYTALNGYWEMFKMIVGSGADLNARECDGKPFLHLAASSSDGAGVSFLIQQGENVNETCPRGTTALHWAKTSEIVERLIAAGLNIEPRDCMGCTPLHFAANRGNVEVVAALLKEGADANIDAKSLLGETPLHHAGSSEVVGLLVEAGANLESRDRWGRTPLYYAQHRNNNAVTNLLLYKGADPNALDYIGESATIRPRF